MNIGEKIKYLRLNNKITSKELSKILDISASALSLYENGMRQPKLELIVKISELFNVSTDFLLGVTEYPKPLDHNKEIDFHKVLEDMLMVLNQKYSICYNGKKMDKDSFLVFKSSLNMVLSNMNILMNSR